MVFKSKNKHPQTDRQTNEPNLSSLKSRLVFQSLNCIKLVHVTFTTIKAILFTVQLNHDIAVYFSHIFFLRDFFNLLYIVLKNLKTNEDVSIWAIELWQVNERTILGSLTSSSLGPWVWGVSFILILTKRCNVTKWGEWIAWCCLFITRRAVCLEVDTQRGTL